MYQKIGLKMARNYSPNFNLPKRVKNRIKFIIIHYTGMKKESAAIKRLQDPKSKVSSHYLIKKNGEIINLVPDLFEAWHAGVSSWKNFKSLNKNSIGIEITNPGHQHGYKKFSKKQIFVEHCFCQTLILIRVFRGSSCENTNLRILLHI